MFVIVRSEIFNDVWSVLYSHRNNPLYETTSAALKSRDSNHVTSTTGACSTCCLLILVIISLLLAAAAVAMATFAVTMQIRGTCL